MGWVDRFSLAGKTALVTGASSGIGAEISRVFTEADAKVIATGQSIERLDKLKVEIGCEIITADIASAEGCKKLISEVLTTTRQIDILVNSAGVALVGTVLNYSAEGLGPYNGYQPACPFSFSQRSSPRDDFGQGR